MKQTILVTGASGFLGSYLVESLVNQCFNVVIVKRTTSNTKRINHLLGEVRIYNIDDFDFSPIFIQEKVDVIINTVCSYGRGNESLIDIVNSNLIFGLNLLEEAIKNNVKTFINTDSLLPRNINDYSLSKAQFTDWLCQRSKNIQVVNLKIEHMYGPKDDTKKFLPWLIKEMTNEKDDINLTSGIQRRDFIYITDIVDAYILVIQKRKSFPNWTEFDVGTNVFTDVKTFVLTIAKELEKKNKVRIIPRLKFGSILYRKGDIMTPKLDNTKLINLGWVPKVSIIDGIQNVLKNKK